MYFMLYPFFNQSKMVFFSFIPGILLSVIIRISLSHLWTPSCHSPSASFTLSLCSVSCASPLLFCLLCSSFPVFLYSLCSSSSIPNPSSSFFPFAWFFSYRLSATHSPLFDHLALYKHCLLQTSLESNVVDLLILIPLFFVFLPPLR